MVKLVIILGFLVHSTYETVVPSKNNNKTFIYDQYMYDQIINVVVNGTTEQILDFHEAANETKLHAYPTRAHISTNDTITEEYPIFITALQQKGVSSWEIPLVVKTSHAVMQFKDMARTLCPHDAGPNITSENRPTITVSTWNPTNISVQIKLRRVRDFYVEVNNPIELSVTPSSPKYYYFSFDQMPHNVTNQNLKGLPRFNYTIPKSVILIIESDDDVCAVVSIQNNSCPVFDNEQDMLYQGYHLTMTTKGGITLTQSMFPVGFYIVFIVKQNDDDCLGVDKATPPLQDTPILDQFNFSSVGPDGRTKNFRFTIKATISYKEYVIGAVVVLALVLLIAMFALVVYIPGCKCSEQVIIVEETPVPSSSHADSETVPIINEAHNNTDSEPECEATEAMPSTLTVADMSRAPHNALNRRSNRYFWSALTVAVVYALPVVQLLSTYQHMVFQTGNQDLCYYNFLCAHPLGFLSDFNHVYSNIGYVLLGLAFMLQVRTRQVAARNRPQNVGIPQHHGLFYSMGLALVMEGVLSACYHLCPNKMNFQFDSSFMYVIAVLCMVKIYQNRHPDVNASAHSTFILLAFIMAIGVYGIMYPSVYFWVFFTIAHLATCFYLTLNIYYLGRFKLERTVVSRVWRHVSALPSSGARALLPTYLARAILLTIANLANWALAGYGLYEHNKDFARHMLAILMGNTILYTLFYVIMKVVHREKILLHTWLYLLLAHVAWFLALRFFLDSNTKWSESPALSRRHNRECSALQFLDSHDTWHCASAAALYLSFNMLLTVDDALQDSPRHNLPESPALSRRHNRECSALQFLDSHDTWHCASAAALYLSFNMLLTVDDALQHSPRHNLPVF